MPTRSANCLTMSGSSVSRRNATSDIRRWFRMRNSTVSRDSRGTSSRSSMRCAIRTLSRGGGRRLATSRRRGRGARAPAAPARRGRTAATRTGARRGRRRVQALEVADGQQRVLVDRVLVVEVADDAEEIAWNSGEHPAEQSAVVHLREPRVEAGARLQKLEQRLSIRGGRKEMLGGVPVDVLLDRRQRFVGHRRIGVERGLKQPEPAVGLAAGPCLVDEADAVARSHEVHAHRRRRHAATHSSDRLTVRACRK